jgi:hypothetical protein
LYLKKKGIQLVYMQNSLTIGSAKGIDKIRTPYCTVRMLVTTSTGLSLAALPQHKRELQGRNFNVDR